jgi:hypothetical protein
MCLLEYVRLEKFVHGLRVSGYCRMFSGLVTGSGPHHFFMDVSVRNCCQVSLYQELSVFCKSVDFKKKFLTTEVV